MDNLFQFLNRIFRLLLETDVTLILAADKAVGKLEASTYTSWKRPLVRLDKRIFEQRIELDGHMSVIVLGYENTL